MANSKLGSSLALAHFYVLIPSTGCQEKFRAPFVPSTNRGFSPSRYFKIYAIIGCSKINQSCFLDQLRIEIQLSKIDRSGISRLSRKLRRVQCRTYLNFKTKRKTEIYLLVFCYFYTTIK